MSGTVTTITVPDTKITISPTSAKNAYDLARRFCGHGDRIHQTVCSMFQTKALRPRSL